MNESTLAQLAELLDDAAFGEVLDELEDVEEPGALWPRVEALFGLEDWDELEEVLDEAMEDGDPPTGRAAVMLGFTALNRGELTAATAGFDEALALHPADPDALRGRAGVLRMNGDDPSHAESVLRSALAALPHLDSDQNTPRAAHTRALVRRDLGMLALEDADYALAEQHWQAAADAAPEDGEHLLNLARLYAHLDRPDDAAEFAARAAEATPLLVEAYALQAQALAGLRRFDEAIEIGRAGVAVDPEEPFSVAGVAHCQLLSGDFEGALRTCDAAIELDPTLPDAYQIKATALASLQREDEFRQDDAAFLQMEPMLPGFLDGGLFGSGPSLDDVLEQVAQMSPDDLRMAAEHALQSGLLPEAMRPMVESMMGQLPQLLQQLPSLLGGEAPLTEVPPVPSSPVLQGDELRKSLRVIDGGKDSDG